MLETSTNVDGSPSILRIETTGDENAIKMPPFVKVLKDITDDSDYESKNMAN